jgi:hypothetical protein
VHEGGPTTVGMCGEGWPAIVAGVKSLLETGVALAID